jgi:hypothetical protein
VNERETYENWRAELSAGERPPSRRRMQEELDRLNDQAATIRRYRLPNAASQGPNHVRRVKARLAWIEQTASLLFEQLNPPAVGWDNLTDSDNLRCAYCEEYVFHSSAARHAAVAVCPRCDPDPTVKVSPFDPNWRPGDE